MSPDTEPFNFSVPAPDLPDVDFRPYWHQLIVIGNGFDLECDLKSGFGSFAKARRTAFESSDGGDDAGELHFRRTLWDFVLASLEGPDWCDVEGAIKRWLVGAGGDEGNAGIATTLMDDVLDCLEHLRRDPGFEPRADIAPIIDYLVKRRGGETDWSRCRLLERTMADLHVLETDFAAYLYEEIGSTKDYPENASRLMAALLRDSRADEEDYWIDSSVLSFNYTMPLVCVDSLDRRVPLVNIHGLLCAGDPRDEDIVFGIDGTGLLGDPDVLPFTKTYRIMGLGSGDDGEIVHVPPVVGGQDNGTALIKFYGHSLAPADYSYFQAIFDAVRLYEGDTRLIFYYRRHSKGEISDEAKAREMAKIRTETMKHVIALLSSYGETLDNKDHGRNLIHKLLIEGRLIVKPLPDYGPDDSVRYWL